MRTQTYLVKQGDTLWDISKKFFTSPYQWPRLWKYNNRKDVIAYTGRGIKNPDLIYPEQKLLLPITAAEQQKSSVKARRLEMNANSKSNSLMDQLDKIKSPIAINYNLDEISMPPIIQPNAVIEFKLKGSVVLSSKESLPITYVTNKGDLSAKITEQANRAFSSLVSNLDMKFDTNTGNVTVGMNLIAKSNTPNIPTTSIGIQASSNDPIPKIKYELKLPELKGSVNNFNFVAANVSIAIEVTPSGNKGTTTRNLSPSKVQKSVEPNNDVVIGLAATATLLVVGTLVEDFFTAGFGVADDPASFTAAAGMYAKAFTLWRGSAAIAQRALMPSVTRISISISPVTGTALHAH